MNTKSTEIGDERNRSFESPDLKQEELKPGFKPADQQPQAAPGDHHRFPHRRDKKDVPQESLAERIRKAQKGG